MDVSFKIAERPHRRCPNCNSMGLSLFYSVDDIPVNSCLLMSSKEQALNCPRANLQLGFCRHCGFITNIYFDPKTQNFTDEYEGTQSFSACFNTFANSLTQKLIDKYDIYKKNILEIGCGQGEFVTLMCELGDNTGIGIDPAYVAGRNQKESSADIKFIQDLYSKKYAHLKADVIFCRHTLEHIAGTFDFLQTIRQNIGKGQETLVFFEVPDATRVFCKGAFWDIYYEHCSYFTASSLYRLFNLSGFKVEEVFWGYGDQYLMITAYPAEDLISTKFDIKNDLEQLADTLKEFKEHCVSRINYWENTVQKFINNDQRIVLWGSSSNGVSFLNTLKLAEKIEYVVDINPNKHGKYIPGTGQKIVGPRFLTGYEPQKIIMMNPVYRQEIQRDLDSLNIKSDLLAVTDR